MKFYMETLGCKVNAFESDATANALIHAGYLRVDQAEQSDVIICYTCAVTNVAEAKTRKILRGLRRQAPYACIVAVGCYSQVTTPTLREELPVDIWIGSNYKKVIVKLVNEWFDHDLHERFSYIDADPTSGFQDLGAGLTNHTRANLKIQDGCNQFCTYCIIPYTRGRESSLAFEQVMQQADALAKDHGEIVLTGIHTGRYHDQDHDLADLLEALATRHSTVRFRISSIEITEVTDKLLRVMQRHANIAHHLHIPLQTGSDEGLKRMHRPYTTQQFLRGLDHIRDMIPGIAISTDYIAGFVGESVDEFNRSLDFIKACGFSFLHVFPYSRKKGTQADKMEGHLDESIKKQRAHVLLELSNSMHQQWLNQYISKTVQVVIESYGLSHSHGYTSEYAYVDINGAAPIGTCVTVKVDAVDQNHLIATLDHGSMDRSKDKEVL